jgi:release factor glutamine methyltransferase
MTDYQSQYIAGEAHWRNFKLAVSAAVLIPRPETECLIDLAVASAKNSWALQLEQGDWADLGTGSGAIALGLADAFAAARIHAIDCSQAASAIALANALQLDLQTGFTFIRFLVGAFGITPRAR